MFVNEDMWSGIHTVCGAPNHEVYPEGWCRDYPQIVPCLVRGLVVDTEVAGVTSLDWDWCLYGRKESISRLTSQTDSSSHHIVKYPLIIHLKGCFTFQPFT